MTQTRRRLLVAAALGVLLVSIAGACFVFGARVRTNPRALSPAAAAAIKTFDDSAWARVLTHFVDEEGRVDYDALAKDPGDLEAFVALIAEVGPTSRPALFATREDRLAYYINAYNALTLVNVLDRYPAIKSVYDARVDFFALTRFRLDQGETSLHALENDRIRPTFGEPRVHFALNCASLGCPHLPRAPFRGPTLEAQLRRETDLFLHDPRNVAVVEGELVLSEIFDWYADDFKPTPRAWIAKAAPDLGIGGDLPVRFRPYDWALNRKIP